MILSNYGNVLICLVQLFILKGVKSQQNQSFPNQTDLEYFQPPSQPVVEYFVPTNQTETEYNHPPIEPENFNQIDYVEEQYEHTPKQREYIEVEHYSAPNQSYYAEEAYYNSLTQIEPENYNQIDYRQEQYYQTPDLRNPPEDYYQTPDLRNHPEDYYQTPDLRNPPEDYYQTPDLRNPPEEYYHTPDQRQYLGDEYYHTSNNIDFENRSENERIFVEEVEGAINAGTDLLSDETLPDQISTALAAFNPLHDKNSPVNNAVEEVRVTSAVTLGVIAFISALLMGIFLKFVNLEAIEADVHPNKAVAVIAILATIPIAGSSMIGAGAGGLYGVYGMAGACLPQECSVDGKCCRRVRRGRRLVCPRTC